MTRAQRILQVYRHMEKLSECVRDGGQLMPGLYLPRMVWEQDGAKIPGAKVRGLTGAPNGTHWSGRTIHTKEFEGDKTTIILTLELKYTSPAAISGMSNVLKVLDF